MSGALPIFLAMRSWPIFASELGKVPDALVNIFPPPAVSGLGRAGGFRVMVEDRGDLGLVELQHETDNLVKKGNETGRPCRAVHGVQD